MKIKYFQTDAGYIAVTDQCPKDFKGVLYIGKSGTDPLEIEEAVFEPGQVRGLREIALVDMPAVWVVGFGYEKPVAPKKPEPVVEEFPLFDPETGDLEAYIPIRRIKIQPRPAKSSRTAYDVGLIIGLLIGLICIAAGLL